MKTGDIVLQSKLVARWANGKRLALIGDGDAISICVAYLRERDIVDSGGNSWQGSADLTSSWEMKWQLSGWILPDNCKPKETRPPPCSLLTDSSRRDFRHDSRRHCWRRHNP